jgi:hypothetical protein
MLAGTNFTDKPHSVCHVIAALLRTYNDRIDDRRRQDLHPVASDVIGTRAAQDIAAIRTARCLSWAWIRDPTLSPRLVRRYWPRRRGRLSQRSMERAGALAAQSAVRLVRRDGDDAHRALLALVEALIAVGKPTASDPYGSDATPRSERPVRPAYPAERRQHAVAGAFE